MVTPTYVNGVATTTIGPPTSGVHITDELWTDAWGGQWHCTAGGTPGTWRQHRAAIRSGEPGSGTIPSGYVIIDANDNFQTKFHLGSYVWGVDSLSEDDAGGIVAARPVRGIRFLSLLTFIAGTSSHNIGTNDWAFFFTLTCEDFTPSSTATLFSTHSSGNNRLLIQLLSTGAFRLSFIDSGGSATNYDLAPDVALVENFIYQVAITLDRDGLATLYINGSSDRNKNGTPITVSIAASSAVDIGSGNTNPWRLSGPSGGIEITWISFRAIQGLVTQTHVSTVLRGLFPTPGLVERFNLDLANADPSVSTIIRETISGNNGTTSGSCEQVYPIKQLNVSRLAVGAATILAKLLSATAILDFGSINAAASADLTITVTGALVGDSVSIGLPAAPDAGIVFFGFVSAANTVTLRAINITGSPVDPASATYRATVHQFA